MQSLFLMTLSMEASCQIYVECLLSFDDELPGNLSVVYSLQAETSCLGAYKSPKSFFRKTNCRLQTSGTGYEFCNAAVKYNFGTMCHESLLSFFLSFCNYVSRREILPLSFAEPSQADVLRSPRLLTKWNTKMKLYWTAPWRYPGSSSLFTDISSASPCRWNIGASKIWKERKTWRKNKTALKRFQIAPHNLPIHSCRIQFSWRYGIKLSQNGKCYLLLMFKTYCAA